LHVTVEKEMAVSELIDQLRHAGIDVKDFRNIVPSLEDVFISMVEK
jgi:hypothetical protein